MHEISYSKQPKRILDKIAKTDTDLFKKLLLAIESLKINPHPTGSKRIKGVDKCYRIRVRDYRIIYTQNKQILHIYKIGHRREIYDSF